LRGHRRIPNACRRLAGNGSAKGTSVRSHRASPPALGRIPGRMPDAASACAGAVSLSGRNGVE
jgi:hypothetical protein